MINRLLNNIHRFLAQDLSEFKADITNLFVRAFNSITPFPVLMEDNQLNINQPLLSVRRISPKSASQKSESRKFGSFLPTIPSIEPCKTEFKLDPLKNTGNIPFVWELSPGRPKDDETNTQIPSREIHLTLPKLPPGKIIKPRNEDHLHLHSNLQTVYQESGRSIKKESTSNSGEVEGDDDTNEEFVDALDTLSRGDQSSFYNCSASGVTVTHESDVKQSKSDPKLRDFMMGRFLPAAKAMASETPHHSSRRNLLRENPREVKKLANMENKKSQLRYGPNFLHDFIHDNEEESSDDEYYYEHGNPSRFCGLLPRFCSKGSFHIAGPVPGISMRSKPFTSSNSLGSFIQRENQKPGRVARSQIPKHEGPIDSKKNFNCPKLEGSKLYNRLQGCGISASFSESFQSIVSENDSSTQKKRSSFKQLLNGINRHEDSIIEKTLYVDTENPIPSSVNPTANLKADGTETPGRVSDELGHDVERENGDEDSKDSEDSVFERPAAPPLPKSPSDSWLGRTLPSVSSKRWNPRFRSSNLVSADVESKSSPLGIPRGPLLPIPET